MLSLDEDAVAGLRGETHGRNNIAVRFGGENGAACRVDERLLGRARVHGGCGLCDGSCEELRFGGAGCVDLAGADIHIDNPNEEDRVGDWRRIGLHEVGTFFK